MTDPAAARSRPAQQEEGNEDQSLARGGTRGSPESSRTASQRRVVSRTRDIEADRERSRAWHAKRYARGQCHTSGCTGVLDENPHTKLPYWSCRTCRRRSALEWTRRGENRK